MERIIHTQIYHYLEGNKILADNQHGFMRNSSTSTAVFDVLKELYGNWNVNKFSGCLFIDFSHTFNSIEHTILAEKLKLFGFDNTSLHTKKEGYNVSQMFCKKLRHLTVPFCPNFLTLF